MTIDKVTTIEIKDSKKNVIHEGQTVVFHAKGLCLCGVYRGMSSHGALRFETVIEGKDLIFNVLPRTINYIEIVDTICGIA